MPNIKVSRSIDINAPLEKIQAITNDLHHWPKWSPWLITDPKAKVQVNEDGRFQAWDGPRCGAGELHVVDTNDQRSSFDLTFLKPWKSKAKTSFEYKPTDDGHRIIWNMDSSLPWFMFWMKKQMEAFIGMDYERGLTMLKEYIEEGQVYSALDFKGSENFAGGQYVGFHNSVPIADMPAKMEKEWTKLRTYMAQHGDLVAGDPLTAYDKWDMVRGMCTYRNCIPVHSIPSDLPSSMVTGTLPAAKVQVVRHTGRYHHVGNGFSAGMFMAQKKEFKMKRKGLVMEIYRNSPKDPGVDENKMVSDICFPMK